MAISARFPISPLGSRRDSGPAIASGTANVYLAGTGTLATVYSAQTGGGTLSQPITAGANAVLPGWLDYREDGYDIKTIVDGVEGAAVRIWQATPSRSADVATGVTGSTSSPTTSSTADPMTAVIPEMTITQDFGAQPLLLSFGTSFSHDTAGGNARFALYDGSTEIAGSRRRERCDNAGTLYSVTIAGILFTPTSGSHTISARWNGSSGTLTANALERHLSILKLAAL